MVGNEVAGAFEPIHLREDASLQGTRDRAAPNTGPRDMEGDEDL